jgi:uncharacterized membrane protein YdjX (TVP38/TMEM64 family)
VPETSPPPGGQAPPALPPPAPRRDAEASAARRPAHRAVAIPIDRRALCHWLVGVTLFAVAYGGALLVLRRLDLEGVARAAAARAGPAGVAAFLSLMALAVMSPLPDSPVALTGLVAYGPLAGLALVVTGSWLGAVLNFLIVRALGREAFRRRFPRAAAPIDDLAARLGFELLVLLRFLPTVTFDVVSYAAAVTSIRFAYFAGATLLGQLPGPTIAALVGAGVGGADHRLTLGLSALAFVLLALVLLLFRLVRRRRPPAGRDGR